MQLVGVIKSKERSFKTYQEAFDNVVEEVAYTWFNRLIAIRFMEVNDYLPSGVRVLSADNPAKKEPDIVTKPFETDLEFTSAEQSTILRYKDENKPDELFRLLFIKQCNKLHEILPELFEKTNELFGAVAQSVRHRPRRHHLSSDTRHPRGRFQHRNGRSGGDHRLAVSVL